MTMPLWRVTFLATSKKAKARSSPPEVREINYLVSRHRLGKIRWARSGRAS
jgi:hypothetical protein